MVRRAWVATVTLSLALSGAATAQEPELEITLKNGADRERRTEDQLRRLLSEYDVARWTYTREIVIDESTIPHSHPVLTLHTRHLEEDLYLLSTFVHEQFHWLEEERADERDAAIADFSELYPMVPVGRPDGGRDANSTYLHLIVCDLEYQAMTILVGEEKAKELMAGWNHYVWIYDQVINNPEVRVVNERHGFIAG